MNNVGTIKMRVGMIKDNAIIATALIALVLGVSAAILMQTKIFIINFYYSPTTLLYDIINVHIDNKTGSKVYPPIGVGPFEPYVLADIYAWLESHSGLSHSLATAAASAIGANTTSSSSKR